MIAAMKTIYGIMFAGLAAASLSGQAHACACCADPGQRTLTTEPMDGYIAEEFKIVTWSNEARPFLGPCDDCLEGIKGLSDVYKTKVAWSDGGLVFKLTGDTPAGTGTLSLAAPQSMDVFSTDQTPGDREGMVTLYKEWRVETGVTGTGAFSAVTGKGHKASLVLHGRGNSCEIADGMSHWSMDVKGPGVDFRLYGRLNQ